MEARGAGRRTGGRSARVRAVVHAAVAELLADPDTELTIAAVAARSGVHPTSLYRRWGTLEGLVLDVAVARLSSASPMPDTGTLRGDLLGYAHQAAHDLAQPDGLGFLRAVLTASAASGLNPAPTPDVAFLTASAASGLNPAPTPDVAFLTASAASADSGLNPAPTPDVAFLTGRGAQIQAMLDRAAARGEPHLTYTDVLDIILAPLYLRALFHLDGIDDAYLDGLVDRLLAYPPSRHLQRASSGNRRRVGSVPPARHARASGT